MLVYTSCNAYKIKTICVEQVAYHYVVFLLYHRVLAGRVLASGGMNAYTIQKNGLKKMIYQTAWKENGVVAGLVEFSMVIPEDMPHYIR